MAVHDCTQEKILGEHESTLLHISRTLDRFVSVAEKIAAQGENIIDLRRDTDNLFSRVRDLEMAPGKEINTVKHNVIFAFITMIGSFIVAYFTRHIK